MARTGGIETVNIEAPAPGGATPRLMRGRDRAATVRRLRRDGWSYRRISDAVGLPYNEVSRLLDNDVNMVTEPVRLPPAPLLAPDISTLVVAGIPPSLPQIPTMAQTPVMAVTRAPEPPPNGVAASNTRTLLHKVDALARAGEEHRKALEQLSKDVAEVRTEQRVLGRRLQELFTALWQRMLEIGRRPLPPDEASP